MMPSSVETRKEIDELVAHVNSLRLGGLDFPTIWQNHLRGHALVIGIPIQWSSGEWPHLRVRLVNGRFLRFDGEKFDLE
jgi:hypothetical protein